MMQLNVGMKRVWLALLMLTLLVAVAACGAEPAPPSVAPAAPVEATVAPLAAESAPVEDAEATEPTVESAQEEAASTTPEGAESATATGATTFVIDSTQSEVRFTLTEVLMGTPTTVVGRGNGIEGTVTVNFDDYSQTTFSPIVIDASLLATDNNMRNGQIRRAVLQTNQPEFQFITFTPTSVEGYPESATVGQPFDLLITGDLTIRTVTKPMTFEVTVTPVSETSIQGIARTTLLRADFELQIPSVPSVADVSEEVLLEFDFMALAQ